jgi:hypothetical protein
MAIVQSQNIKKCVFFGFQISCHTEAVLCPRSGQSRCRRPLLPNQGGQLMDVSFYITTGEPGPLANYHLSPQTD